MKRGQLLLSDYKYLIEYYNYDEQHDLTTSEIVMLRLYDYTNNIANDMCILFITLDDLKEIIEHVKKGENLSDLIVFPNVLNTNIFSKKFDEFNKNYTDISFYNDKEIVKNRKFALYVESLKKIVQANEDGSINIFNYSNNFNNTYKDYIKGVDIYPIYTLTNTSSTQSVKTYNIDLKQVHMDHIRIYHPNNNIRQNLFVMIDNYVNNIHMIFLSKNITNMNTYSEDEIIYEHQYYSEYFDVLFPNFKDLFDENNFYVENLNNIEISKINDAYLSNYNLRYIGVNEDIGIIEQYLSLKLLLKNYRIETTTDEDGNVSYEKVFKIDHLADKYYEPPINLSCYPFNDFNTDEKHIDDSTYRYSLSQNILPGHIAFAENDFFNLQCYLGFDSANGNIPAIISKFNYPAKYGSTIEEAYCTYYDIKDKSIYDKDKYSEVFGEELTKVIENKNILNDVKKRYAAAHAVTNEDIAWARKIINDIDDSLFNYLLYELKELDIPVSVTTKAEIYIKLNYDKIDNDVFNIIEQYLVNRNNLIKDEDGQDIQDLDFIGYKIEISSDSTQNDLLYSEYKAAVKTSEDSIGINSFIFPVNNLFNTWNNLPDTIFVRTMFIDRFTGVILLSNIVIITKEYYKYLVNDANVAQISTTTENWKNHLNIIKNNTNMKILDATSENTINFNFIDKVNCIVNDEYNINKQTKINNINTLAKQNIIYKPIFFKVNNIQNIRIRKGVEQNIAINLESLYSKVNTIKLVIEQTTFYEIARYDSYCIFNVDASKIGGTAGTYDIYSDVYINSGSWYVFS